MENKKSPIFAGIMLIGLGILVFTGWWWPGIMLVIGTALGVDKFLQGQVKEAIGLFLLFLAIPTAVFIFSNNIIPWTVFAPILLIGIGGLIIGRSLLNRA
jgi:hypothetical protein